jgi:hypothetical protein
MKTILALTALVAAPAFAQIEGDVHFTVESGKITIGLIAEDESSTVPGLRVFFGELGLDIPNVGTDPGWLALDGTFAASTPLSFDFLGSLKRWNGSSFSAAAETMTLAFGPANATTPAADSFAPGFALNTDDEGGLHDHPSFTLNAPASDGIYLLPLQFSAPGLTASDPVWMLWGQNASESDIAAAYDYSLANIPAPTTLALAAIGVAATTRRRR